MRRVVALAAAMWLLAVGTVLAAEPQDDDRAPRPSIVVTTEVLGSVVSDLAGDVADVRTLMGGGADPHSWQPSARDSEAIFGADLIVANGLDLEEGLLGVLEQAASDGVPVFHAAEHVDLRASAGRDDDPEHQADGGHAAGDPHFWLDPLAMRDVVLTLDPVLIGAGIELGDAPALQAAGLEALDVELRELLSAVPDGQRRLVTGHGALGYFADAYDFDIVGTVVPGLSSSDEPSARDIADLVTAIREAGATVVFSDVGTPQSVAETVAGETGAQMVELEVAQLPEGGGYADLMRDLATTVAGALST
jgi:zinc/manganese transport system substrate-binding protein